MLYSSENEWTKANATTWMNRATNGEWEKQGPEGRPRIELDDRNDKVQDSVYGGRRQRDRMEKAPADVSCW